jgi:hypothetical protein
MPMSEAEKFLRAGLGSMDIFNVPTPRDEVEAFMRRTFRNLDLVLSGEIVHWTANEKRQSIDIQIHRLGVMKELSIALSAIYARDNTAAELVARQFVQALRMLRDDCNQELWRAADLCEKMGMNIAVAAIRGNIHPQADEKR